MCHRGDTGCVPGWGAGGGGHCTYQQQQQQGALVARAPRHRLAPPHPRLRTSPAPCGSSRPGPTRGRPSPPQPCPGCGSRCGRVRKGSRGPAREPGGGECAPRGGASQFPPSAPGAVTSRAGDLEWLAPPRRVSWLISPSTLPLGSARVENFLAACPDPRTQGLRSGTRNPRSQGCCGNRLAVQEWAQVATGRHAGHAAWGLLLGARLQQCPSKGFSLISVVLSSRFATFLAQRGDLEGRRRLT